MKQPRLDTPARLLHLQHEVSEYGEHATPVWVEGEEVWVEVTPTSGGLVVASEQEETRAEYRLTMRYQPGLRARQVRFRFGGRTFAVIHVAEPPATRRHWLTFLVGEAREGE